MSLPSSLGFNCCINSTTHFIRVNEITYFGHSLTVPIEANGLGVWAFEHRKTIKPFLEKIVQKIEETGKTKKFLPVIEAAIPILQDFLNACRRENNFSDKWFRNFANVVEQSDITLKEIEQLLPEATFMFLASRIHRLWENGDVVLPIPFPLFLSHLRCMQILFSFQQGTI